MNTGTELTEAIQPEPISDRFAHQELQELRISLHLGIQPGDQECHSVIYPAGEEADRGF